MAASAQAASSRAPPSPAPRLPAETNKRLMAASRSGGRPVASDQVRAPVSAEAERSAMWPASTPSTSATQAANVPGGESQPAGSSGQKTG